MRSLKLDVIKVRHLPYTLQSNNTVRCIQINDKYFILSNNTVHFVKNDSDSTFQTLLSNVSTIDWIPVENILYMGNGRNFQCFNVQTEEINVIEVTGGYVIHEWNPSQDRVAIIDDEGILKMILLDAYNCQCTFIGEYKLNTTENSPFINIGWGSKTTQFRGSVGKYYGFGPEDHDVLYNRDFSSRIAWRDDGDIFAVSFNRDCQRIFKIFSCECDFLYESEIKPGLGAELTWKPDGSLIATASRTVEGHYIMFFEKNGLLRYDLKLPSIEDVKKIQWNPTGDILMIWQQCAAKSEISLLTCSNFKWHLKQSLIFNKDNLVNDVEWSDKKWLDVVTTKYLVRYSWRWVTFATDNDMGAVVVVDGNVLRVTTTATQIIPPPYSSYNIEFEKPINYIAFGHTRNTLAVVLNDYTVKILEPNNFKYVKTFSKQILNDSVPLALNNFVYNDKDCILYCVESLANNKSAIHKYGLDFTSKEIVSLNSCECTENVSELLCVYEPNTGECYLGVCDGLKARLCRPKLPDLDLQLVEDDVSEDGGQHSILYHIDRFHSLSLNSQRFYYNGHNVARNITSYLICHGYVLLTTTENKLLCIKLSQKALANNLSNVYTRSIPSGALLISAVPGKRKIILQVPRGELEIINPRVLTIDEIDRLMANKQHLEAYRIMRTDRINPNLLYDLNPTRFLNDIDDFVRNINNCEYLDVFLTQLQDSNVSEELYRNCFEEPLPTQSSSKLKTVADMLIKTMKQLDVDFYLQSIITAYLCKNTDEDLAQALGELSAARQREQSGVQLRVPVDSTLEHMIILSSVEKLYDIALGMDKLDIIMWVASKSQLDPLEYIPFLRELVNMGDNYRNYKINCHIKRFEKAFTFLIQCDDVLDELNALVINNSLYKVIVKYLKPDNQWYQPLMQLYAKYLSKEAHYKESGLVFMRINAYESALESFVKGCCVKEALTVFSLLGSNVTQFNDTLLELISRLIDKKQFKDASFIYDSILNNYEESISVLIKGCLWSDAMYLAYKNQRRDIIESEIKPAILNYTQDLCSNFQAHKEEFTNLKNRLQTIRNDKIQQVKEHGGSVFDSGEYPDNVMDYAGVNVDLESVVSTTYSRTTSQRTKSSHKTSASARRKKRIEKKVLQIREGSAFENVAIIRRLYLMITEAQSLGQTVSNTCMQLISYPEPEYYEKAAELHSLYNELLVLMDSSRDHIWPQEMLMPPSPNTIESQVCRLNIEHLEIQYRFPPQEVTKNWKVLFSLSRDYRRWTPSSRIPTLDAFVSIKNLRSSSTELGTKIQHMVGRSAVTEAGELWMQTEDTNIAQNMGEVILRAMSNNNNKKDLGPKLRIRSSSANEASKPILVQRRQTHSGQKSTSYCSPSQDGESAVPAPEVAVAASSGLPLTSGYANICTSSAFPSQTVSAGGFVICQPHLYQRPSQRRHSVSGAFLIRMLCFVLPLRTSQQFPKANLHMLSSSFFIKAVATNCCKRQAIDKIDQSEFEGFEYVNPLKDCV